MSMAADRHETVVLPGVPSLGGLYARAAAGAAGDLLPRALADRVPGIAPAEHYESPDF